MSSCARTRRYGRRAAGNAAISTNSPAVSEASCCQRIVARCGRTSAAVSVQAALAERPCIAAICRPAPPRVGCSVTMSQVGLRVGSVGCSAPSALAEVGWGGTRRRFRGGGDVNSSPWRAVDRRPTSAAGGGSASGRRRAAWASTSAAIGWHAGRRRTLGGTRLPAGPSRAARPTRRR